MQSLFLFEKSSFFNFKTFILILTRIVNRLNQCEHLINFKKMDLTTESLRNSSNQQTQFNELPVEMQFKILELLSIRDLLKARLVCKLWNDIVSKIKMKELEIKIENFINYESDSESENGSDAEFNELDDLNEIDKTDKLDKYWYHTKTAIKQKIKIDYRNELNLHQIEILKQLKRFRLNIQVYEDDFKDKYEFKIEHLNEFKNLIQLEIVGCQEFNNGRLVLPNLELIYIEYIDKGELIIESSNLKSINCYYDLDKLKVQRDKINFFTNIFSRRRSIYI